MTEKRALVRLVDDDDLFRTSQAMLLQMHGWSVATYDSAQAFLAKDDPTRPGCLILDVRMPTMTGLELQDEMNARGWHLPIVFLTGHGDISMAVHSMQHGAVDFLEKPVPPEVLLAKVEQVVAQDLAKAAQHEEVDRLRAIWQALTPREQQIIRLAALNQPNKVIAQQLDIAETTVKMHRGNAFAKFNVNNALDAYRLLVKISVLGDEDERES